MQFFASCARGVEYLLVDELKALGASEAHEALAGVHFSGTLEGGYRAAIGSRLASRILLQFAAGPVASADELYQLAATIEWEDHFGPEHSFAVHGTARAHPAFRDTRITALKVKDAVVDRLRARRGARPAVERRDPDIALYAFVDRKSARIGLDLIGRPLHERGYRTDGGAAPLKETLAAAIVIRSGWSFTTPLVDPLCGSGTLLIEAAMMAGGVAPGCLWAEEIVLAWPGHDRGAWRRVLEAAREERLEPAPLPPLVGLDRSATAIAAARANARRAGVGGAIRWGVAELKDLKPPDGCDAPGTVVANLPYGRRMGAPDALYDLYRVLGERLVEHFGGWEAALFGEHEDLFRALPLKPSKRYRLYNGAIACSLFVFPVPASTPATTPGVEMVVNRITKNLKKLRKYLNRNEISCFRAYDADLPEYACAVDVYGDWVNVQEYQAPPSVPRALAERRLRELIQAVQQALDCPPGQLVVRRRARQRGRRQYARRGDQRNEIRVQEGGLRFIVNLSDYLDTGLFPDHRQTRALVRDWARDRQVLNLFCYTGAFTVYAAAGGAAGTTSVDLSATYLEWARRNLSLNGFEHARHRLIRADCLQWLAEEQQRYDLIVLDPPTFSNSKRMRRDFDVNRDHVALIGLCTRRLAPGGRIVFSTNSRRFRLDRAGLAGLGLRIEEISARTVPPDFARRPPHRCWVFRVDSDPVS